MTRQEWTELARGIREQRGRIDAAWAASSRIMTNCEALHDRKLIYYAQIDALEKFAHTMVLILKRRSSRFDEDHFLTACGFARNANESAAGYPARN